MPAHTHTRPSADEHAPFYHRYIALVPDGEVVQVLAQQADSTQTLLGGIPEARAGHRYAPGKWSIREVVGHLADTERILGYRALRIARGDTTPLPGFDENAYVAHAGFEVRPLRSLCQELLAVRQATLELFGTLPAEAWIRRGTANQAAVSVRALAYIIAGHELHHRQILQHRYLAPDGEPA